MGSYNIDFEPVGRRVRVESGTNLLAAAQAAGIGLVSLCGGEGWCESCQVRLVKGVLTPVTMNEEANLEPHDIAQGMRLACQAEPLSDLKIDIPPTSLSTPQRLQLEGREETISVEPNVAGFDVEMDIPTLYDLRSDVLRLQDALAGQGVNAARVERGVLSDLSDRLRCHDWKVRVAVRDGEVVGVYPIGSRLLGMAADVGTTKLAIYLMDLESGETVEKAGAMNPQISFGEDVMSRISYSRDHVDGRKQLQERLVQTLNLTLEELCSRHGVSTDQVVEAVIVGNTAMHHLFAGLPVEQLGLSPCIPTISEAYELPGREVGLNIARGGWIYLLPNIAGFVGADHVSMVMATEAYMPGKTILGVDIGTNTEITLQHNGTMVSCSAASGPAFEGAHIRDGMRAAAGAIERVQIIHDEVHIYTVDSVPPVGICGSGILDVVAEMRNAGVIDSKGALQADHPLVRPGNRLPEFVLAPAEKSGHGRDIYMNRKDINEIQLAKAAIRVGIDTLLDSVGIQADAIDEFIIAGAFGSYINVSSAVRIGMFPALPLERFHQVGNAAGIGAKQALISLSRRKLASELAQRVQYIELTTQPDFQDRFMNAMYI